MRISRDTPSYLHYCGRERREGIAILIVLIIFVVLYLVVYQLHFSSTMEEHVAHVRYGEAESAIAMQSASLFVMTLLAEDVRSAGSGPTSLEGMNAEDGSLPTSLLGENSTREGLDPGGSDGKAGGTFAPIAGASGQKNTVWYDYLNENIFKPNPKKVGDVTVKITLSDSERAFDLNRLFNYVRLDDEDVGLMEGQEGLSEEDVMDAVGGKSAEEATQSLRDQILSKSKRKSKSTSRTDKNDEASPKGKDITGDLGGIKVAYDYTVLSFVPPGPRREEATVEMLDRAINMMFLINEQEYGYLYPSGQRYVSGQVARAIVDYVLERRMSESQPWIHLISELLNIPGITSELYYGPMPRVDPGEELPIGNFVLAHDEFGDLVPEYMYSDMDDYDREMEAEEIERLLQDDNFGQFADFAGMGFDPLQANPLTRGMKESPVDVDEDGVEYVVEAPIAIGLKDLFTTFSSGKININTASVPVLHGLLRSCLQEGEADIVALDINDYRNRFQEERSDDDGIESGSSTREIPDLGQPRRRVRKEEDELETSTEVGSLIDSLGLPGEIPGLDAGSFDGLESTYQNIETNYFTDLRQLELIDGTEEGPDDLLRRDQGVERVSEEDDTLLRRVIHDLEKVAVFGSTYFTAELKGKSKTGRSVKTGYLTVRRDMKKGLVEVVMWKSLQK